MKYFELIDNESVPGRWHLSKIVVPSNSQAPTTFVDDDESDMFWTCRRWERSARLFVAVYYAGRELDFCRTNFAVPIARSRLAAAMGDLAGDDLQRIAVDIPAHEGFEVLNALRLIKCVDETRSDFIKWTKEDHRADKAGQYRQVVNLHVDVEQIPPDAHIFRIEGWKIALVVSEKVKLAMEAVGCIGAQFTPVT